MSVKIDTSKYGILFECWKWSFINNKTTAQRRKVWLPVSLKSVRKTLLWNKPETSHALEFLFVFPACGRMVLFWEMQLMGKHVHKSLKGCEAQIFPWPIKKIPRASYLIEIPAGMFAGLINEKKNAYGLLQNSAGWGRGGNEHEPDWPWAWEDIGWSWVMSTWELLYYSVSFCMFNCFYTKKLKTHGERFIEFLTWSYFC